MKICLISFDSTYFDHHIAIELKSRNLEVNHIDASKFKFKHTSFYDKMKGIFSKKNKKKQKKLALENHILSRVKKLEYQNVILFIRPDKISRTVHLEIKKHTDTYLTYLYDSCNRFSIDNLINGVFDEIFSFDLIDIQKYKFTFISNFIYLKKKEINYNNNRIFIVISIDERFEFLNKLADYLSINNIPFKFVAVGKKKPKNTNKNIIYFKETLKPEALEEDMKSSKIFLDLIRKDHNGLSFRIFEALAMQRKIITTNASIKKYDFYNPNNILILDEYSELNIDKNFLKTPYEPLADIIYQKYTIESWVNKVFKI